jgi:hypothetical protein
MNSSIVPFVPLLAAFTVALGAADYEDPPSGPGVSGLFSREVPLMRHWSLGVTPYSGSLVPAPERARETFSDEYGVQIGAHWRLGDHVRIGFEVPYALGWLSPVGTPGEQGAAGSAPIEPRLTGMLTLALRF